MDVALTEPETWARVLSHQGWVLGPPRAVWRLEVSCCCCPPRPLSPAWTSCLQTYDLVQSEIRKNRTQLGALIQMPGQDDKTAAWELRLQDRAHSPMQSTQPQTEHMAPYRAHGPMQSTQPQTEYTAPDRAHSSIQSTRPRTEHMAPDRAHSSIESTQPM